MTAHRPDAEPSVDADVAAAQCSRCGAAFTCGIEQPGGCWCARLPVLPAAAVTADAGCLCEACLTAALARAGD
jgi:hypothetical protein